jgi:hypothetical protein
MNGRRSDSGPGEPNPWVRRTPGSEPEEVEQEPELPPSPWNHPVDPPAHLVTGQGADPTATGTWFAPGQPPGPGVEPPAAPFASPPPGPQWAQDGGPAEAPSLRREPPPPERRTGGLPKMVLPIVGALVLVAVIGVVALKVLGGDEAPQTQQTPGPSSQKPSVATATTRPSAQSTYTPPPNAIPVAYGVSVVPKKGWKVYKPEKQGKQLVNMDSEGGLRAFFWVRQRKNVGAEDYVIRIFEGETLGATGTKASQTQRLKCPRDVLVECVSITYSTVLPSGVSMRGVVQGFRRQDGVVTAMDFQARPDYYDDAYADARVMLKSVIASQ